MGADGINVEQYFQLGTHELCLRDTKVQWILVSSMYSPLLQEFPHHYEQSWSYTR
jgi:hypothetical protein